MRTALVLLVVVAACASAKPPAPAPAPAPVAAPEPAPPPEAPALRLPRTVLPTGYKAALVIDPGKATFSGSIEIAARAAEPVRHFWLHAQNLTIDKASAMIGGKSVPLEVLPKDSMVALRAAADIPAGDLVVTIAYQGKVDETETDGIFRQKEGDDWYVFTQFESITARRAFPCFDEPDVKVPWQLSLEVPEALLALSNTPVASETPTGRGTRTVTFAPTRPLPSYLIAFAVGPFSAVDAGKLKSGAAFRVIVPRGRGGDVGYVTSTTPAIVDLLEDYFGTPYPFEKLDIVAVPVTASFTAMENPGILTFNQNVLLARKEDFTIQFQREYAIVTAHELAHQWFGDLVTLAWWDDIWLNESFAEWMADKVILRWKPDWHTELASVQKRSGAMFQESLQTARMLRQPITSENDIHNSVDWLSYSKGPAVLTMFERWVGEERFRTGVRAYLAAHAWGNATASDLFAAVGGGEVAAALATFLDQVGTPLVSFELACAKGKSPHLALSQERYVPKGSQADVNQTWQLPVCVTLGAGKATQKRCTLLKEKTADWELEKTDCPTWILPNTDGIGYYRSELKGDLLKRLLTVLGKRSAAEQLALIGDVEALSAAGRVDAGAALAFVPRYAGSDEPHLVKATAGIVARMRELIPAELRPNFARFVSRMFAARARKLGWRPAPGDDEDTRLLRKGVVLLAATDGNDAALAADARKLALAWLDDHSAVDPDMVDAVLVTAAYHGDAALFDRYVDAAKKAKDRADRQRLLGALSGFRQPALVERAIGIAISGDFDTRESMGLFFGGLQNPATRRMVYDTVKVKYDDLVAKLPKPIAPYLVFAGVAQCDAKLKPEVEAFFKERTGKQQGGPLVYAQAMETMSLCIKQREAQRPAVAAFLKKY